MSLRSTAKADNVYVGVDWISGTLGREELDNQTWVYDCLHALEAVALKGNVYKRRSLLGFDGWESGGCFVGSNETMHYAQFAGKYANDAYSYLNHPKVHISRIDLQITVQYDIELIREGRFQYAAAIRHNKSLPEHRRRKIHLYAGSDGSDTIYLGSPSSDTRGRLYNKDKQSGDTVYKHAWRYEIVYRNAYASRMFGTIIASDNEASAIISAEVLNWYRERGVNVLDVVNGGGNNIQPPRPTPSDAARKLAWIKNQVIPTIRKLAEMGYAEELMETIAEAISAARNSQN